MKLPIASLALLCISFVVVPSPAQVLYSNGPLNGTVSAWTINSGYAVSDNFTLARDAEVGGFDFYIWGTVLPITVDWSIISAEFGGMLVSATWAK